MPQFGVVYKLTVVERSEPLPGVVCETIHTYVGSTKYGLTWRLRHHMSAASSGKSKSKLYETIRVASRVDIEALEFDQYDTKKDMRLREEHYRQQLMPDLNTRRCAWDDDELAAHQKKKCAEYYQANKERILPGARIRALARYYAKKEATTNSAAPTNS